MRLLSLLLLLGLAAPVSAQTLYWEDAGELVKYDVATDTATVLISGAGVNTVDVDPAADTLFWFEVGAPPLALYSGDLDAGGSMELVSYPFGSEDMIVNPLDDRVYWINSFNGQLVSVNYDGTDPQVVGGQFFLSGMAVDSQNQRFICTLDQPGAIVSMNFDGSDEQLILGGLSDPRDCRYDEMNGMVYWRTFAGAVQRCTDDGMGLETLVEAGQIPGVTNIVVDPIQEYVYISTSTGSVWRTGLGGGAPIEVYVLGTDIGEMAIIPGAPAADLFVRGDCDNNGSFNGIIDGLFGLNAQFVPGSAQPSCLEACDADGSGDINFLVDMIFVLNAQFIPGSALPPAPFPVCGSDPDPDTSLGCAEPNDVCNP